MSEVVQTDWALTTSHDSDNCNAPITVTAGTTYNSGNDFGNFHQAFISGTKWKDLNVDGSWNEGEPGVAEWGISALKDGSSEPRTAWTNGGRGCRTYL